MNNRRFSHIFVPILLIFLLAVAFVASEYYTFTVGSLKPAPTATLNIHLKRTTTPTLAPASEYPDQAHITDGILLWGIIIIAIIIIGVFYGRRMIM
ncbi:MAG: hypothetical protein ABSA01_15915 [Anaerolineales bacterium]|jgi:hypothetical protein